ASVPITRAVARPYRLSTSFLRDTSTTQIYPLSLHDALPISLSPAPSDGPRRRLAADQDRIRPDHHPRAVFPIHGEVPAVGGGWGDRKSTRLNSSHVAISYAVFCLKKKNTSRYPCRSCGRRRS